jgi:hypothetical protein
MSSPGNKAGMTDGDRERNVHRVCDAFVCRQTLHLWCRLGDVEPALSSTGDSLVLGGRVLLSRDGNKVVWRRIKPRDDIEARIAEAVRAYMEK